MPVREATDELGRGVRFAVPTLIRIGRQPEVRAEVDDVRGTLEDLGNQQLRRAMGQRGEHQVETAHVGDVIGREPEIAVRRDERRIERADRGAGIRVGRDVHDLDLGVPGQQPQQLRPRIP